MVDLDGPPNPIRKPKWRTPAGLNAIGLLYERTSGQTLRYDSDQGLHHFGTAQARAELCSKLVSSCRRMTLWFAAWLGAACLGPVADVTLQGLTGRLSRSAVTEKNCKSQEGLQQWFARSLTSPYHPELPSPLGSFADPWLFQRDCGNGPASPRPGRAAAPASESGVHCLMSLYSLRALGFC